MLTPNTLTYERWLNLNADRVIATMPNSGAITAGRTGDAVSQHDYQLDLSTGSYAVQASAYAIQLTPERWFQSIHTGSRDTTSVAPAEFAWLEEELAGAL